MSANGRGSMRPQSRSPPFLLIGLLVALVILAANYWSLSSNNASLSNEVSDLQDQLRLLSAKNINAEKRNSKSAKEANDLQKTVDNKEEDLKKKKEEIEKLNSDLLKANEESQKIKQDKETIQDNLKSCEENSNGIQEELRVLKEDIANLKKSTPTQANDCSSICEEKKKELLGQIEKFAGLEVLKTLQNNGVDILDFKEKVLKLAVAPSPVQNQPVQTNEAASNQSAKADQQNPLGLPANQQQTGQQSANQQQTIQQPANQQQANQQLANQQQQQQQINPPANQNGPEAPNAADQQSQDDKKTEQDKEAGGSEKDNVLQPPAKTGEGEKAIQPVIPNPQGNNTDAKKLEANNVLSDNNAPAQGADSKVNNNDVNKGILGGGGLGSPNNEQIHPPNLQEMDKIMKDAVKQSVQEALNKTKGAMTTQSPVIQVSERSDVAESVIKEKETVTVVTAAKNHNTEYDEDEENDKDNKDDKDVGLNDKPGGGQEYEEEEEKDKALKFEKGNEVKDNEDSIDKMQHQMANV